MEKSPETFVCEREFKSWLQSVENTFEKLPHDQKNTFLETILSHCASEQLCFLVQSYLPSVYHRDFLKCLPVDCSYNILRYLDGDTVLSCCLVSKSWYQVVSSCFELWVRLLLHAGEKTLIDQSSCPQTYKQMYMRRCFLNDRFKEGSLFETTAMDGPVGTCKVTGVMYKHPVLMLVADGKEVYIWNTLKEYFDFVSYKITAEQNSISSFFMDDEFIYIGLYSGTAMSWRLYKDQPHCSYIGHVNTVLCVSALKAKNLILTSAADYSMKLWDLDSGDVLKSIGRKVVWIRHAQFLNFYFNDTVIFLSFSNLLVNAWAVSKTEEKNIIDYDLDLVDQWNDVLALVLKDDSTFYIQKQRLNLEENITEIFKYKITLNVKNDVSFECLQKYHFKTQLSDFVFKDELMDIGERFAVILRQNIEEKECSLFVRDVTRPSSVISIIPVPHFRSLLGEPLIALCQRSWLDGFGKDNQSGLIYVSPMQFNPSTAYVNTQFRIAVCRWKEL